MTRQPWTGIDLKRERMERGLTQSELAYMLGVCTRTIKNWERKGVPEHGLARTTNVIKLLTGEDPVLPRRVP